MHHFWNAVSTLCALNREWCYATFIVIQKNDLAAIVTQAHSYREGDCCYFIAIYEYTP